MQILSNETRGVDTLSLLPTALARLGYDDPDRFPVPDFVAVGSESRASFHFLSDDGRGQVMHRVDLALVRASDWPGAPEARSADYVTIQVADQILAFKVQ